MHNFIEKPLKIVPKNENNIFQMNDRGQLMDIRNDIISDLKKFNKHT